MPRRKKKQNKKKEDLEAYKRLNEQMWDFIFGGIKAALNLNNPKPQETQPQPEASPKNNIPQIARY